MGKRGDVYPSGKHPSRGRSSELSYPNVLVNPIILLVWLGSKRSARFRLPARLQMVDLDPPVDLDLTNLQLLLLPVWTLDWCSEQRCRDGAGLDRIMMRFLSARPEF